MIGLMVRLGLHQFVQRPHTSTGLGGPVAQGRAVEYDALPALAALWSAGYRGWRVQVTGTGGHQRCSRGRRSRAGR